MPQPTILVTGKNGQLGNELQVLSARFPQYQFHFTDSSELNIVDGANLEAVFDQYRPSVCINAAAYTAVDKAETERDLAMQVNANAVGFLAAQCRKYNARFIHVSTDYVFDGTANRPYTEDYLVNPVNYYGVTKLMGEQRALESNSDSIIIRTSWVYSSFGKNFVKTMLRLMKERESIGVVNDQRGCPTYAADLAEAIIQIIPSAEGKGGVYHFSNAGIITWYDFAFSINELANLGCEVKPITTADYPTPAKRPAYSALDTRKIQTTFGIETKNWMKSLKACIELLRKEV